MRIALEFEKRGPAKYISHLDLQRAFSRAIRRSGLPVAFSKGFNPHYIVSFASALALGIESECEMVEMALDKDIDPGRFLFAMKQALPPGLIAKRAIVLAEKAPKLAASVSEAEYKVFLKSGNNEEIKNAVCDIMNSKEINISKEGKNVNVRNMISLLELNGDCLIMRLAAAPSGSLRPDVMVNELKKRWGGFTCSITRTKLYTETDGKTAELFSAFEIVK